MDQTAVNSEPIEKSSWLVTYLHCSPCNLWPRDSWGIEKLLCEAGGWHQDAKGDSTVEKDAFKAKTIEINT